MARKGAILMISIILNLAALVAAVAAAAAAIFTFMQARSAKSSLQAQVFLAFSDRYRDAKISEAITLLLDWYKQHPDDFAELWYRNFIKNEQEALKLEQARRMIGRFFSDIGRLYESGQISKKSAYSLLGHFGLDVYYNICYPMYKKLYGDNYPDYTMLLKNIRPRYSKNDKFHVYIVADEAHT
jgi:hypothetical protein